MGIHFHVIFLFFGQQTSTPEQMRQEFGAAVFDRWNKIHGGTLARQANRMTLRGKDFNCISYLLKGIDPIDGVLKRETHWHGVRNRDLIRGNSDAVTAKELRSSYRALFPRPLGTQAAPATQQPAKPLTKASIEFMKAYIETTGAAFDWKTFKRSEVGHDCSDEDFLRFLNARKPANT